MLNLTNCSYDRHIFSACDTDRKMNIRFIDRRLHYSGTNNMWIMDLKHAKKTQDNGMNHNVMTYDNYLEYVSHPHILYAHVFVCVFYAKNPFALNIKYELNSKLL